MQTNAQNTLQSKDNVILEVFSSQVKKHPEALAAVDEKARVNFEQLQTLSAQIAEQLPQDTAFAGIVCDHGISQIASIFAVLSLGCAYVPAEPDFPPERIRFMMSETTVCCSYYRATDQKPLEDGAYPVGKAVLETTVSIRDEDLKPLPAGTVGEICIQGEGVSLGYKNPSKNAAFVDEVPGGRLYRSGDMGYELADGNIVFLHRKDTQVMILGKRVETEEVEKVLASCTGIEAACVRAFEDDSGLAYMIAYVVVSSEFSLRAIRKEMRQHLTPFMIPEFFVKLAEIPFYTNGKVDDARLPVVLKEGQY
ncbi:AMP-binding protein [Eggerthellaceae bacterium 3-80]|nr:hypothetical protein D7W09_00985 [bacterium D16-34]